MTKTENQLRHQLAAVYRLSAYFNWMDLTFNHISVRLPEKENGKECYLVNPQGLLSEEMTPSKLVKIDVEGNVLYPPGATVIPAGFTIHSAIHTSREDAVCIMHNHSLPGMVVSTMKEGLLPLTQLSMEFYNRIAYHDFVGIALNLDEREIIVKNLGHHKAMIMRNHGLLTLGNSIPEAFYYMYYLNKSCEIQIQTLSATKDPYIPPPATLEYTAKQYDIYHEDDVRMVWEAMMRKLNREFPDWDSIA